jgi:hypothetical protein
VLAESFSQLATINHIACQSFAKASTSMLSPRHLLFLHSSLRIDLRMLKRESQGSRLWAAEATNHYLQRTKVGPVRDRLSEGGSHCGFLASTSTVTSKSKDRISMGRKIRKSEFSYESSQRAIPRKPKSSLEGLFAYAALVSINPGSVHSSGSGHLPCY